MLKPSGNRKAKMSFTVSGKSPEGTEEKATLKWLVSVVPRDKN
jgi:hypothetical protein